jgi:hypothetical protein
MPNPFVISILILITTLATTPTIANTDLNTPNVLQDFDHTPWEQQQLLLKVIDDLMLEGLSWVDLYQHFIVK